jgi:hypothetical protein
MAAQRDLVLVSIETDGGERCVDIFQRPDGTFGFEEYRRDSEDGRGWFRLGSFGEKAFTCEAAARDAARRAIPWLPQVTGE